MEVVIDRENCGNCQLCAEACPDVFEMRDGETAILHEYVPLDFQDDCRLAAEECPTRALEVRKLEWEVVL